MFIEERYKVKVDDLNSIFEFISEGKNGSITKIVQFTKTRWEGVYNLGFGDKNLKTGILDDKVISDNGDFEKVLATVAATVYTFTKFNPNVVVILRATNKARIRLYQMAISKYLEKISKDFDVYGYAQDKANWELFKRNINYRGFLLQKKINIL